MVSIHHEHYSYDKCKRYDTCCAAYGKYFTINSCAPSPGIFFGLPTQASHRTRRNNCLPVNRECKFPSRTRGFMIPKSAKKMSHFHSENLIFQHFNDQRYVTFWTDPLPPVVTQGNVLVTPPTPRRNVT